ncbi:outer membrane protein assembly factor BamB family protein [Paraclostridium bifermentans]|uniref:outer membrane protein assembly factor BamB family protein n=1 Tax=Paraclostridium bifermentans TaxID=1490 RepID=UPI00359C88DF
MKINIVIILLISCTLVVGCNTINPKIQEVKQSSKVEESKIHKKVLPLEVAYLDNSLFPSLSLINSDIKNILFQNNYTTLEGITTFRGNHLRNSPSFGKTSLKSKKLSNSWEFITSSSSWGGGAGWTGQPAIIKWPKQLRENMNIKDSFKYKDNFTEVIYASLDGNIYFIDLETGQESREKINVGNPIKGSVSVDPRGIPLLYVGEGINENSAVGFNIYSLIDGKKLYELDGKDSFADRGWPAFDSCAIVNPESDSIIIGGENGVLYIIKLNSKYDINSNIISINPEINKYKYTSPNSNGRLGIENSIATYGNLAYFADNNGIIQCIDLNTLKPVWYLDGLDDIDATLTIDVVDDIPYIYCGNEVDHQGSSGLVKIKKINGVTGELVWENEFACESLLGKKPVNGGLMSTNIIGKNKLSDTVIFSLARYKGFNKGGILALDKNTGNVKWELILDNYMWSSPVDIYDENGNGYILQGDSAGNLHLIDASNGSILDTITLNGNIESSPAVFNNKLVVATRNNTIYSIDIN